MAYIAVTIIRVEEDVVHYTSFMLEEVSVIKTNHLMLTKDIMPVLRMRDNFLVQSMGKIQRLINISMIQYSNN